HCRRSRPRRGGGRVATREPAWHPGLPGPGWSSREMGMGTQRKVHPSGVPQGNRPYSLGVRQGNLLFVAGQVGQDFSTGQPVSAEFDAQVRQAIENVRRILEAGGSSLDKVLSVNCWLTDMSKWARMNEIYMEYFNTDPRPPRATVGSALVPPYQFEIQVIAYVND